MHTWVCVQKCGGSQNTSPRDFIYTNGISLHFCTNPSSSVAATAVICKWNTRQVPCGPMHNSNFLNYDLVAWVFFLGGPLARCCSTRRFTRKQRRHKVRFTRRTKCVPCNLLHVPAEIHIVLWNVKREMENFKAIFKKFNSKALLL